MRSRSLVTGGAGFIGSHLCQDLIGLGHHVICVDDLSTGRKENLSNLEDRENFSFIQSDVRALPDFKVDYIWNLACPASPAQYQADPIGTLTTCFQGGFRTLELARKCGARILQASTSEVYGDPLHHPQNELYWGNVNPYGPRACYDEGKRSVEALFYCFADQFGTETRIARIFNTYGPRMTLNDGRVVSNFIVQALRSEDITIYGDGRQTRSFCYVSDMVKGLLSLMFSEGCRGPVNIGNPSEISVAELAQQVIHETRSRSRLAFRPLPTDDPVRRRPDISKMERLTGWRPKVPLCEGLRQTIRHFESRV